MTAPSATSASTRGHLLLPLVVASALAAGACSGPATTMTASNDGAVETTLVARASAEAESTLAQSPSEDAMLAISDVRVGSHADHDRIVVELIGSGVPGWQIAYTDEPRQQGSAMPVDVDGDAVLQVMVLGVGLSMDTGRPDYPVGPVADVGLQGDVDEVYHAGVFEGQSQFLIGLDGAPRPIEASVIANPTRLVIDVDKTS